jgi:hypothetical protein
MKENKYYYFANHTLNQSIHNRLRANRKYELLSEEDKELVDGFVEVFKEASKEDSSVNIASNYIFRHKNELSNLIRLEGENLKYYLIQYVGYVLEWGASSKSYGRGSNKRAEEITESQLIHEMTSLDGSIVGLLDSADYDLAAVKPFLPAIMISLDANTRDRDIMRYRHTGRFGFDFDGFHSTEDALRSMNKMWEGTKNIKPYKVFLSPRGKGFKVFCQVDTKNPHFIVDFEKEERDSMMRHHKRWYEAARKEIISTYPELEDRFDNNTIDPQRLTYIPFIEHPDRHFKYHKGRLSEYTELRDKQRNFEEAELKAKMMKYSDEIASIMKDQNVKTAEDAYYMILKNKRGEFNVDIETEKFISVVDKLVNLIDTDDRVSSWASTKFDDYLTLNKLSWILYACFGDLGIDQLKRLVPAGSNKLDENSTDYRWAVRTRDNYTEDQFDTIHPGGFYTIVKEIGEINDFIAENHRVDSAHANDFKNLNLYYETYENNRKLYESDDDKANLSEFLDNITKYLDSKRVNLPLIKDLDTLTAEVVLGPKDYLDKTTMKEIYQVKYKDKRIFHLRSQC